MGSNFTERSKVMSGARAILHYGEEVLGYASGVDGTEEIMYEPVDVLNNLMVQEHAPVGYRCSMNAAMFRVPQSSLKKRGIFPKISLPPVSEILGAIPGTMSVQDSVTELVIAQMEGVKPASQNFSTNARGLWSQNCAFVGIRILDEHEIHNE